jgi:hypothetical protein
MVKGSDFHYYIWGGEHMLWQQIDWVFYIGFDSVCRRLYISRYRDGDTRCFNAPGFLEQPVVVAIFLVSTALRRSHHNHNSMALLGILLAIILWLLAKGKLKSPIRLKEELKTDKGDIKQ